MKPYRIKHISSGLYYKPLESRKSHLSTNGKVYFTKQNPLLLNQGNTELLINCMKDSRIHRATIDLPWQKAWNHNQLQLKTKITDWKIEELESAEN